jgi:hypothetical protein
MHKTMVTVFKQPVSRNRRVMLSDEHETAIREKGFVKVPFFTPSEAEETLSFYEREYEEMGGGYQSTLFSTNPTYRRNVDLYLKQMVADGVNRYLYNYRPVVCTFLVKHSDRDTAVNLHADWSLTDELKFQSMILWVSLMDIDETNGALHFLPGSHKYTDKVRGHGLPFAYENFDKELLKKHEEIVCTRKGEAIIFDLSCLHYSPNNKTSKARIAFNVGLIPNEAPSLHFCSYKELNAGQMEIYEVGDEFYHQYQLNEKPIFAKRIWNGDYSRNGASNQELEEIYRSL